MKYLVLALATLLASPALAQSAVEVPPTGSSYIVRFTVPSGAVEVCAFGVTTAGVGVDRLPPTGFDKADNYACTTTLTADGTTVNTLTINLTPLPTTDVLVALQAFPAAGSTRPASPLSNTGTLLVRLKAPVIVP